ncbi:hypothetical protein F5148DRAFT_903480 [Russula earlei]|uniref:Uncharacterized protein n=1 Tax=Russula earlei TaxID=71964 RepID=A0ACC0UL47_9AGAM|nr:hypothetical protein F5148DRAFT_903480 [Russula earlei]
MPVALQSNKSLGFSFDPPLLVPSRPNGPFSQNVSRSLRIANPNVDPVAFKIKTTAPKLYVVRPNGGRIEPGESVEVQVIDQEMKEESSLDAKNSDKFLIQSMLIPEEKAAVPLHELWYLHGQEPKIVYIPPNGFPLEVEDEDESPHRMSVITDVAPDNSGRPSTHGTPGDQFSIIQEPSHPAAPPDSSALPEEPSSEDAASGVGVTNWNLYSPQPLPPPTPLVMFAPSRPDPEFVSQYKDAQEDIQWLSALLAADPDLSSVVGSSTNPAVLQERHHTSQVQTANVTVVGSEETNVSHPSLQPEGVSPQVVVTPSPIDKSPTRELSSTWLPKQSDRPTADPSATPESPITDPPSKLERRPEKSLPPIPEPSPAAEVTPARISDIVSPPESPLTEILPLPSPVTPIALESHASHPQETFIRIEMEDAVDAALPVQQSDRIEPHGTDERQLPTDTSSQREEAFMAPMIFDPHKYVTKRMNRKTKSSSNSVSIDHPSSVLMATGIPPKNVDDTSTIPLQDCMGPCEEGVAVLIADSGAMEDTSFTNSFEGVQSALGPSATEQPYVLNVGGHCIGN